MAKSNNLTDFLTDVANAIRAKKGTTAKINPQDFSSEIASISSGGGGGGGGESTVIVVSKGDVNFYDYDGTLLHSYTKDAFLALSALPDLPTREGLICQEWNYTLADAKEYVTSYGILDIGATYITDDGKTRLYIRIAADGRMTLPLYFTQTVANGVTIDWGDGSATETLSGTGDKKTTHTYAEIGDYVITLNVTSGTLGLGYGYNAYNIFGETGKDKCRVYNNMLWKLEIGSSVTEIPAQAFYWCTSLVSVVIPREITSIGVLAFQHCYSLESVVLPRNMTGGVYAFQYCYSLKSIMIPNSVTSFGNSTFEYCYSLKSIVIPSSITSIGTYAFQNCYSLESIVIPNGVTSIGNYAFQNCYSFKSIVIPSSVTSIGTYAFSYCRSLKSIVIPNGVPSIGERAFQYCESLSSIVIPSSVTSIGNYAFYYCYAIKSVVIPSGVTSIGKYAFYYCNSLSSVVFAGVESIDTYVFYYCLGVKYYDFSALDAVPTLANTNAFTYMPSDCKIVVPDSLYSSWTTATNWSNYASKTIKASEFNG